MSAGVPVSVGDVLAQKFRVDRVLGSGGMGVVVAATHLELDQRVALKFLLPTAAANASTVERFLREARATARLRSEHVVRVSDVGRLESGSPYIVMEHLKGRDLFEELRARGRLPIDEAIEHVLQACEALAEAHSLGIVHRDLKPANLFLTRRTDGSPQIKLLDFGLAKDARQSGTGDSLTNITTVMGTPTYMSPEQIRSTKEVDARGDVWALAVILFELVTGSLPFEGPNVAATMLAIATDPPRSARALRPEIPEALELAIGAALVKKREQRTPSIVDLAKSLAAVASPAGLASIERIRAGASAPLLPDSRHPPAEMVDETTVLAPPPKRRDDATATHVRRAVTAVIAVAGICSLVCTVFLLTRSRGASATTPAVTSAADVPASSAPRPEDPPEPAASASASATTADTGDAKPKSKSKKPPKGDLGKILDTRK